MHDDHHNRTFLEMMQYNRIPDRLPYDQGNVIACGFVLLVTLLGWAVVLGLAWAFFSRLR